LWGGTNDGLTIHLTGGKIIQIAADVVSLKPIGNFLATLFGGVALLLEVIGNPTNYRPIVTIGSFC
jgi:hypothetical protein